jgi:hypothetical protein
MIILQKWRFTMNKNTEFYEILESIQDKTFSYTSSEMYIAMKELVDKASQGFAITRDASDGCHTFNELYDFRKMYNAALFNEWAVLGKYNVHKSKRHFDGEECFGGDFFVVTAMLPLGQITNHYNMVDWDLFSIPEHEKSLYEYDGHNGLDTLERIKDTLVSINN